MHVRSPLRWLLLATAIPVTAAAVYFLFPRPAAPPLPTPDAAPPPDPRVTYSGPYTNVRPEVKHVGDAICSGCHIQGGTFAHHPMGRSLKPVNDEPLPPLDAAHRNPFPALGSLFRVDLEGGRVWQRELRADDAGRPVYENAMEAHYVIGSGNHGHSYLTDRGGYVFQTPISWYSAKQIWDLSPGWRSVAAGRPVKKNCLFCHCNEVKPIDGYINRYEEPLFRGTTIGCERCHGPGELHAAAWSGQGPAPKGKDYSIVNPKDLLPPLRDAVCQQCHLEGEVRFARRGRGLFDFRPGLPLADFWTIAVHASDTEDAKFVNHVEQMEQSRCFRASAAPAKLGCASCHDPHVKVPAAESAAYYRGRCLTCHQSKGCSAPEAERQKTSPADSCSACHMPRFATSDIVHIASTDHRVPRTPTKPGGRAPGSTAEPGLPVRLFHKPAHAALDAEESRDLGIALANLTRSGKIPPRHAVEAAERLTAALGNAPSDVEAWEAKANALMALNRTSDAIAALEAALALDPKREAILVSAATLAMTRNRIDEAIGYWTRAVDMNPWHPDYRGNLTLLLAATGDWDGLKRHGRAWLDLDPGSIDARKNWVGYLLRTGDASGAKTEFAKIEALKPKNQEELRTWFEQASRRAGSGR